MDKVNLQTFRLDNNFKNSETSEEDILASLFSIPISENNDIETREFLFPSNNFDNLDKNKLLRILKSLNLEKKDLDILNPKNADNLGKKTSLLKILKSKIIPDTNNNMPDENKFELKLNLHSYNRLNKTNPNKNNSIDKIKKLKTFSSLNNSVNLSDNFSKLKKVKTDTSLINDKLNQNYQTNRLSTDLNISEDFENDESFYQLKNSNLSEQKIFFNNNNTEKLNLQAKTINENQNQYSNNQTRIDTSALKSNLSNEHSFHSDKNMNFLLDNYIEELNMSEKGWTEKLVIRLEKAVNEGSEEIELFLKPKELGSLKVNLLLNKNNAKIIFRAENNFVVQALQQSENLLTKLFNEQGMQIEATNYENNNFNNHSEFNSNNRKFKNGKAKSSDSRLGKEIEKEQIEIENSNYIINVKA